MHGSQPLKGCRRSRNFLATALVFLLSWVGAPGAGAATLDDRIDQLAAEVNDHSAKVEGLQESLLYPVNTRLTVFLTLETRKSLDLDSVELFVNDRPVASHLYTPRERSALEAGGVQQLYIGNIESGAHTIRAVITARSADKDFVRREASHPFTKRPGALGVELKLGARAPDFEPYVSFTEWK